jgi:tetratricopeptide (TPR) repeat protein
MKNRLVKLIGLRGELMTITNEMKNGYSKEAIDILENALKAEGENLVEEAIGLYSTVISLCPLVPYAYAKRGYLLMQSRNYHGAIADFDKAIGYRPDSPNTIWYRANAKEQLGDLEEAIKDYAVYIQFRPEDIEGYISVGMIFEYQKKYDLAREYYNKALEIDGTNNEVHQRLETVMNSELREGQRSP